LLRRAGAGRGGDGLAEEITNALAQIGSLKVIARTSAFAFKGKNENVRKIAETLFASAYSLPSMLPITFG